jgi:hypothetical protein
MRWLQLLLVVIYVSSLLSGSTRSATDSWMDVKQAKFSHHSFVIPAAQQLVLDVESTAKAKEKVPSDKHLDDCLGSSMFSVMACQQTISRVPTDEQIFSVGHHRTYRSRAPPVIV